MKTFVSFSTKDRAFVSKLKSRLRAQGLDVWDYSTEGEEIPGGVEISKYLADRVSRVNVFIPVISEHSLAAHYPRLEVSAAVLCTKATGKPRIIPLVARSAESLPWSEPFESLRAFRYYPVRFEQRGEWENAVARICRDLDLHYQALLSEDPRLPFMDRFEQELRDARPRDDERFDGLFSRLERIRCEFIVAYEEADFDKAHRRIRFFLAICEHEFPEYRFYYPTIALVICLIALGRLSEGLETALSLRGHIREDETLFGLIGYIKQAQGASSEAVHYYQRALELDSTDPCAASGVVVNKILAGDLTHLDQALGVLEHGAFHTEADRDRAETIRAFALAAQGNFDEAMALFSKLVHRRVRDENVYISFADALRRLGRLDEALRVLNLGTRECPATVELLKWKMQLHLARGQRSEAVGAVDEALQVLPEDPELKHYRLICLRTAGRGEEARLGAVAFLDGLLPITRNQFYYAGYANWLLGRSELAGYDFARSGRAPSEYYK